MTGASGWAAAVGEQVVVEQLDRRRAAVRVDPAAQAAAPRVADDRAHPARDLGGRAMPVTNRSWAARSRRVRAGLGPPSGSASHGFTPVAPALRRPWLVFGPSWLVAGDSTSQPVAGNRSATTFHLQHAS